MNSKISGVEIRELAKNEDNRGWLAEIFRDDELDKSLHPAMAYVSMTKPGETRGPHEHKTQTDLFCFLGLAAFDIYLWDNRPNSKTFQQKEKLKFTAGISYLLSIPPGVVHAYKNIGGCDGYVFNAPNKLYQGVNRTAEVDEIRHENNPDSPFKLTD